MNRKTKAYLFAALTCILFGWLILIYYQITRYGIVQMNWDTVWKAMIIGVTLYVGLIAAELIRKKIVYPLALRGEYLKAYALIFALCILSAAGLILIYKRIRYGLIEFEWENLLQIMALSAGLFIFFFVEIRIIRGILRTGEKGIGFTQTELKTSFVCMIMITMAFIPVFSDYATQKFPFAYNVSTIVSRGSVTADYAVVGEIVQGKKISQEFLCSRNGVYSIQLEGATYIRTNTCTLTINLVDEETEAIVEQWNLDGSRFRDNSYFAIYTANPFSHLDMKGKKYRIDIFSDDASPGNALTLYYLKTDYYPSGDMQIADEKVEGDLNMTIMGISGPANYERVRVVLCLFCAAVGVLLILYLAKHRGGHNLEYKEHC